MKLTTAALVLVVCSWSAAAEAQLPTPPDPWTPPVGIPAPPFGITQVAGAATHYVDNTHPSASDTSNPNGTASRPRLTVPVVLPPGAVVEVRGGPYQMGLSAWTSQGTAQAPVFVKGVGMPVFLGGSGTRIAAVGSYFIIEGVVFERLPLVFAPGVTHFAFRRSILRNHSPGTNSAAIAPAGTNLVFFANEIHNNGDPGSTVEIDVHGIKPDSGAQNIWVLDNHMHHHGGDSIQIGNAASPEPWAQRIYIGRNTLHEDRENAIDIKKARDVIVSQNLIYGYRPSTTSGAEAIVTHDGAQRVWIVNNIVSASNQGIVCTGADGYYVVGNIVTNIRHVPGDPNYDPNNVFRTAGILTYNTLNSVHVNNTLWAVDAGISYAGGTARTEIANNIISNLLQPSHHIAFGSSTAANASLLSNNLLDGSPRVKISGGVSGCTVFPHCINANPQFIDAASGAFDLNRLSPAVDAGMTHPVFAVFQATYGLPLAVDNRGTTRPRGAAYDLGAFEYAGAPSPPQNPRIIR